MKKSEVKFIDITKKFKEIIAVDNISCSFEPGTLTTILGPSGCGKTTSLSLIAGLERATQGSIFIDDDDVTLLPATDRDVSMVFQSYALFPHKKHFLLHSYGEIMHKIEIPLKHPYRLQEVKLHHHHR
jgi:iron(III) transport system ATP-binding protein